MEEHGFCSLPWLPPSRFPGNVQYSAILQKHICPEGFSKVDESRRSALAGKSYAAATFFAKNAVGMPTKRAWLMTPLTNAAVVIGLEATAVNGKTDAAHYQGSGSGQSRSFARIPLLPFC